MPPPIETVTGVFAATAEDAVAVTVTDVEPASSLTLDGLTDSVIEAAAFGSNGPAAGELRQPLSPCSLRARTPTTYVALLVTGLTVMLVPA